MARVNTMPGAPSELDIAKTQAAAMTEKGPSRKYVWYTKLSDEASKTEFPLVPFRADPYDDMYNIKTENTGANGMQVMFTDADAAYQLRKRTDDEQARFDAWLCQKYDLTDPAQNNMLQQICPSLFQRREELIDNQQGMVTQYAKIRLRGAKSEDDLRFQWLLDTKRIELPKGPVWDPILWRNGQTGTTTADNDQIAMAKRYQAGYFSPLKWLTDGNMGHEADTKNYFNIAGTAKEYNAYGQRTRKSNNYPWNSTKFDPLVDDMADYEKDGTTYFKGLTKAAPAPK